MKGEIDVSQSIIDELHSLNTEGDIFEGEGGVTRSIIGEFHYSNIQRDEMEA